MSKYSVEIKEQAQEDLKRLLRSEPNAYSKALQLISELYETPREGTGHPEHLKGTSSERWSREITQKHRLVYQILESEIRVYVLSSYGHYDDK